MADYFSAPGIPGGRPGMPPGRTPPVGGILWNERKAWVEGSVGPYPAYWPGGYGRNAAQNMAVLEQFSPQAALNATIQYSPTGYQNPGQAEYSIQNALSYAEEEISRFDGRGASRQRDGRLDMTEMATAFEGNVPLAQHFMRLLDRNRNGFVETVENAAFVLFQDAPRHLLSQTLRAFGDPRLSRLIFTPQEQQELQTTAALMQGGNNALPNGISTAKDRAAAHVSVMNAPGFTGQTLDGIIDGLQLPGRYRALQQIDPVRNQPPRQWMG
ncbi:MAG: hypothetical protein SFZ03_02355 [Candidatus Melainabacteria bacterium]|nr:hypothetical protein [Candidatus Melainabacteria bacterium]